MGFVGAHRVSHTHGVTRADLYFIGMLDVGWGMGMNGHRRGVSHTDRIVRAYLYSIRMSDLGWEVCMNGHRRGSQSVTYS